jgi:hypothetical protein
MRGNSLRNKFYFDFSAIICDKLPLTQRILKACKIEINNLKAAGFDHNSYATRIIIDKSKLNAVYTPNNKVGSTNLNFFAKSINSIFEYYQDIRFNFVLKKDKIVFIIDRFLGFSSTNLNYNAYYFINDKLYVSYKDSFLLVNKKLFTKDLLNEKNYINPKVLYTNTILDTYKDIHLFNLVETLIVKFILYIHLLYLKAEQKNRLDFRVKQTP